MYPPFIFVKKIMDLFGEDSKTYNKLPIVYEYNIHHHIRNKLSLSINVILKPSEETYHLSLTSH